MDQIIHVGATKEESQAADRALFVRDRLLAIRGSLESNFYDMCELLLEAQEEGYHHVFGYVRFGDWVEDAGFLDMSERQAYYMLLIAKKAKELGIPREAIIAARSSKLKKIFELDAQTKADEIRELVANAPEMTLEEVKDRVDELRGKEGLTPLVYMTLKLEAAAKDVIKQAIDKAKMEHGGTEVNGDPQDISDSAALELVCASYLAS